MDKSVEPLIAQELDALEFDLVELRRGGSKSRPVLEVRIDRRDGEKVSVGDCARVSRVLEEKLEADALVSEAYVLEVSSPGADRPLRSAADWRRFVGRRATVTSSRLSGGKQEVEILALDGGEGAEVVTLRDIKGIDHTVDLHDITAARLAFHWKR